MYDQKKAVEAAKSGAKKYAAPSLDYLRQFAGIDCGSRDVEEIFELVRSEIVNKTDLTRLSGNIILTGGCLRGKF